MASQPKPATKAPARATKPAKAATERTPLVRALEARTTKAEKRVAYLEAQLKKVRAAARESR